MFSFIYLLRKKFILLKFFICIVVDYYFIEVMRGLFYFNFGIKDLGGFDILNYKIGDFFKNEFYFKFYFLVRK